MATVGIVNPAPVTLYAIEETLAALADTAEMVPAEVEAEFAAAFAQALTTAVEKRDRVGQFMAHLEAQIELAKAEIQRLQDRKRAYESALDRVEGYVVRAIENLGPDAHGKTRKLEGKTVTFVLHKCPDAVKITDEAAIPAPYKTLTIKVPAEAWEQALDAIDLDARAELLGAIKTADVSIDKRALKAALDAGPVPGADLSINKYSLRRT